MCFYSSLLDLIRRKKRITYSELQMLLANYDGAAPADVLYFGDSVLLRVSRNDVEKSTLDQIFARKLAGKYGVLGIAHTAYHMLVYRELARVLQKTTHRPKVVVLPINLRSFSPQWDYHPSWQFLDEIAAARRYWLKSAPIYIFENDTEIINTTLLRLYLATPVYYPETGLKTVGYFRNIIDTKPENEAQRTLRLQNIFRFHYMHELVASHRKIRALSDIIRLLNGLGVHVIAYVTPINWRAGEKYAGNMFVARVKSNVRLIKSKIDSACLGSMTTFADFSLLLDSDCFFGEDNSTEHLNEKGREILSDHLKELTPDLIGAYGGAMA